MVAPSYRSHSIDFERRILNWPLQNHELLLWGISSLGICSFSGPPWDRDPQWPLQGAFLLREGGKNSKNYPLYSHWIMKGLVVDLWFYTFKGKKYGKFYNNVPCIIWCEIIIKKFGLIHHFSCVEWCNVLGLLASYPLFIEKLYCLVGGSSQQKSWKDARGLVIYCCWPNFSLMFSLTYYYNWIISLH